MFLILSSLRILYLGRNDKKNRNHTYIFIIPKDRYQIWTLQLLIPNY